MNFTVSSFLVLATLFACAAMAQENPYFITYDHQMEEPGALEVAFNPVFGQPGHGGNRSLATSIEFEYGTRGWWTTALYLDGQATSHESTVFTGFRFENRFRLLMEEHAVNPIFYIEYEDLNGADKVLKEVVGFDSWRDLVEPNGETTREKKREVETKLILSRNDRGWNYAVNLIAEKNLAGEPWEFGYAIGLNRPLALAATARECRFCPENFSAGLELYGGLGEQNDVTLSHTSRYVAPCLAWSLPNGLTLRASPSFGLTSDSDKTLLRVGISYEIPRFGGRAVR